jgi:hypothetical protein
MKIKKINYLIKELVIGQNLAITIIKKLGFNQRNRFFNNKKNQLLLINDKKIKIYKNISKLSFKEQRLKTKIKEKLYNYGIF